MRKLLSILLLCTGIVRASAQETSVTLGIGDAPPPFIYSTWIQGTPFDLNEKDKIYVVEFWATWCGPCIQMMPHLSELSQKYAEEAKFIGVNVWENTGDAPYESILPKVTQFVEGSKEQMTYNVVVDNNDLHMGNNWMRAAGQNGIPASFVIQNNQIVWIGHPIKLDEVLPALIDGTFDVEASKEQFVKAQESSRATTKLFTDFRSQVDEAVKAKDFGKAFQVIDESMAKSPMLTFSGAVEKMNIYLDHFSEKEAMAYVKELLHEQKSFGTSIAMTLSSREGLSSETYSYAATLIDQALESNPFSALHNLKADALLKANRKEDAADALRAAIDAAKKEIDDPKFAGRVFDYTIKEYEDKLNNL